MKKRASAADKARAAPIHRSENDHLWQLPPLRHRPRIRYPWEAPFEGPVPPITKAHFHCRGSNLNPPVFLSKEETLFDCNGNAEHTLPMPNNVESIPFELIDLLNFLQRASKRPVHITAGHRCPKHQRYVNPAYKAQFSKHLIGAEVTFYIEGLEEFPMTVIDLIRTYYETHPTLAADRRYTHFERYEKGNTGTSASPWFNREVFVKLYQSYEGRDFDNNHSYPYLSLQLRHTRAGESVRYTHEVALHSVRKK